MTTIPANRLESLLRQHEAIIENDGSNARSAALMDLIIAESARMEEDAKNPDRFLRPL